MPRTPDDPDAPLPLEDDPLEELDADMPPEPPGAEQPRQAAGPEPEAGQAPAPPPSLPPATTQNQAPAKVQVLDFGAAGGTYEVVRSLGEGGMALVQLGRRRGAAGFERLFALKCVRDTLAQHEAFRQMPASEAKLASRLHHPNIAAVYDLQQRDDKYYVIMEYVAGDTLRAALQIAAQKNRVHTEEFAIYVGAELADALHYAHGLCDEEGKPLAIVHRDITPTNIMLGAAGEVKILDFGIAFSRLRDRDKTQTEMFKGKFAYLSPEQARGNEELDGRSDLYALGLVLVEILNGRRVFDNGSDYELIKAIGSADQGVTEQAIGALSPGMKDILRRALAPDRADRFQNSAEFAHALRSYAAGNGIVFGPVDCVRELEMFRELPDHVQEDGAPGSAETPLRLPSRGPGAGGAPASPLSPVDTGAAASEDSTAARRREQIREKLRNPQNPTRRLAVFGLVVLVILVLGNWIASVFFRGSARAGVEIVETDAQRRARTEVELKQASAAQPLSPILAQPSTAVEPAILAATSSGASPGSSTSLTSPALLPAAPAGAKSGKPARTRRTAAKGDPEPRFRRRTFGTSTRTSFVDAPSTTRLAAAPGAARLALPPGTLIPARLLVPVDAAASGPVSAEVTQDVNADGAVAVPRGSTILCTSQSVNGAQRVPLTCNAVVVAGATKTFSGTAIGQDKRPGLPVAMTGAPSPTGNSARNGALDTAENVASELAGGADGVAGALARNAIRMGGGTARSATAPGPAAAEPVPAGRAFYVFVQQSGGFQ